MKENNEENFDAETSEYKKCYSLNSDSFNEIKEDKNLDLVQKISGESDLSKKDSLSSLNISNIDIPPINIPNTDNFNSNNIKEEIGKSKTDFIRIIRHIISTAEMSNKTNTLNNISPKSKRPISIIISVLIPILCSFPIGIIVNAITGNESTKWVFISVVISVFWIVTLIVLYNYITSN